MKTVRESKGLSGSSANRKSVEFFQVALDRRRADVSFADTHLVSPLCTTQSPGHCADNDPHLFRVACLT